MHVFAYLHSISTLPNTLLQK